MGLIETTTVVVTGIRCDVSSCAAIIRPHAPITGFAFSAPVAAFEVMAMASGWSARSSRSLRWYCPAHEARAYACNESYCPVEGTHDLEAHGELRRSTRDPHVRGREHRDVPAPVSPPFRG